MHLTNACMCACVYACLLYYIVFENKTSYTHDVFIKRKFFPNRIRDTVTENKDCGRVREMGFQKSIITPLGQLPENMIMGMGGRPGDRTCLTREKRATCGDIGSRSSCENCALSLTNQENQGGHSWTPQPNDLTAFQNFFKLF